MTHRYVLAPDFKADYVPCCVHDGHEGDVHIRTGKVYRDANGVPMTYTCAKCAKGDQDPMENPPITNRVAANKILLVLGVGANLKGSMPLGSEHWDRAVDDVEMALDEMGASFEAQS